jgi:peroxiredoxin Q/BCP
MALEIGVKAPEFTGLTDNGENISLNDYKNKWIVLYFYPKDNTTDCTIEACEFRDNMERITSLDAVVLGVSRDDIKSHKKFKVKYDLNFAIIADPDKIICEEYKVLGEKSMFGKKYFGIIRTTFIINPDGDIAYVFNKVKVKGHVDEVIAKLNEIRG